MSGSFAEDLAIAYTPGVAEPCRAIENPKKKPILTRSSQNTVAVVSDGSAVLGLGNIGALAAKPCLLWKEKLPFLKILAVLMPSYLSRYRIQKKLLELLSESPCFWWH